MAKSIRKNRLPNCKYTPRQFAQRVEYMCQRWKRLVYSDLKVVVDIDAVELVRDSAQSVRGCPAVLFAFASGHPEMPYYEARDYLLEYLGFEVFGNWASAYEIFIDSRVDVHWPHKCVHPFSDCRAYGINSSEELNLQHVRKTWRQFVENIRSAPEASFFNIELELPSVKDRVHTGV